MRNVSHKKLSLRDLVTIAFLGGIVTGCFQPALPISMRPQYPIDVFFEKETTDRPYNELQLLTLSGEEPLNDRSRKDRERLLYRGNDVQQKDLLMAKLVIDAQKLGADALANVKYRVFTSEKTTGYQLEGLAVKYRGE